MAVNIHITIIEPNALKTKRQNLSQELDAVIHLLMEAKNWGLRKSRNAIIFFNDSTTTEIYTLSLHDALPISANQHASLRFSVEHHVSHRFRKVRIDRKSTRLNSSHSQISYAAFCLKKTPYPTQARISSRSLMFVCTDSSTPTTMV